MLPADQLAEVIARKNKADLFVDGVADLSNDTITLTRGDLTTIIVSLSIFSMDGACKPDFNSFELDDYGYTLRFGEYEASAHSVLYRADPTYRRRVDRQRINQRSPRQGNIILQLVDKEVGDVLMVPTSPAATPVFHIRQVQKHRIPFVFGHRRVEGISAPLLAIPFHEVGRTSGRFLAEYGHRRVAFFTSRPSPYRCQYPRRWRLYV